MLPRFLELKFRENDPAVRLIATGIIAFCFAFYIAAQFDAAIVAAWSSERCE